MKKLRKLVSLLLAVVMMMSLCAVQVGASGDGTITVNNATSGTTYYVYKLLDVAYSASDGTYSYTIDSTSDWFGFFVDTTASGDNKAASAVSSYVTVTLVNGTYYVTWSGNNDTSTVQAFGQAASTYATTNSIDATASQAATDSTVSFTDLELGYYLVWTNVANALVELETTNPSATVVDKNAKPTITKLVSSTGDDSDYSGSNTVSYTDTVYYKVTITGIDELTALTLHDTLPTGFELVADSISVEIYEATNSTHVTLTTAEYDATTSNCTDGCSFEINFGNLLAETSASTPCNYYTYVTNATDPGSSYLVVTYKATATSSSYSNGTANTNTAWLVSSTAYESDNKTTEQTTDTYIYDFYVYKYTGDDVSSGTALEGAKFILYYTSGNDTYYYAKFDSSGNFDGWTDANDRTSAVEVTSDANGLIHISGLKDGTYYLLETEAPSGYSMTSSAITVTITKETSDYSSYTVSGVTTGISDGNSGTVSAIAVKNSTSTEMPTTGGIGVTIFYVLGGVIVVAAVVLIVVLKKRTAKVDR